MIGKKIRELRTEKGLKQIELAEILNVTQSTIVRYENGKYEPSLSTLIKICKYFEVSADYLLGLTDY